MWVEVSSFIIFFLFEIYIQNNTITSHLNLILTKKKEKNSQKNLNHQKDNIFFLQRRI
jgi:hypothetical protein